jgi:hypothetical protein
MQNLLITNLQVKKVENVEMFSLFVSYKNSLTTHNSVLDARNAEMISCSLKEMRWFMLCGEIKCTNDQWDGVGHWMKHLTISWDLQGL